jgi:DNA-binding MarR family transcriptional regulator
MKFAMIPEWVIARFSSLNHMKVYAAIASFANKHTGQAWPSVAKLSAKTGLDERAVKRATAGLVKAGLVSKQSHRGRGKTNLYRLLDEDPE